MSNAPLIQLAKLNHSLLTRNVEGLSDEEALVTLFEGGNHLNWLVAHLVASRDSMLKALGAERVRSEEIDKAFSYGSTAPTPEEAWPLAQHLEDYLTAHDRLLAALSGVTAEQLAQPFDSDNGTLGYQLNFMLWHEAYHVGQATLYRRKAGHKSPIG